MDDDDDLQDCIGNKLQVGDMVIYGHGWPEFGFIHKITKSKICITVCAHGWYFPDFHIAKRAINHSHLLMKTNQNVIRSLQLPALENLFFNNYAEFVKEKDNG